MGKSGGKSSSRSGRLSESNCVVATVIPKETRNRIKKVATTHQRSVSGVVSLILKASVNDPEWLTKVLNPHWE